MLLWVYVPAAGRRRTARCTSARGLAAAASSLPRLPAAPRGWGPLLCYQLPALCLGCVMAAWMKLSCLANTSLCVFQCAAVESSNSRQVWHKEQCDSKRPTPPQLDGMRWSTARRSRAAGAWRSVQGSRLYFPTRAVLRIPLDLSPSNRPKPGALAQLGKAATPTGSLVLRLCSGRSTPPLRFSSPGCMLLLLLRHAAEIDGPPSGLRCQSQGSPAGEGCGRASCTAGAGQQQHQQLTLGKQTLQSRSSQPGSQAAGQAGRPPARPRPPPARRGGAR